MEDHGHVEKDARLVRVELEKTTGTYEGRGTGPMVGWQGGRPRWAEEEREAQGRIWVFFIFYFFFKILLLILLFRKLFVN
jgi:hypothetical protein